MSRAVLFDLDCTLTERAPSLVRYAQIFVTDFHQDLAAPSWEAAHAAILAVDERGYAPRENVYRALQSQLAWRQLPDLQRIADHWQSVFPRTTTPREGALEVLHELRQRGFLIGLVTNGRTVIQRPKIETLGILPLLDCVVVSEEVGQHKPHAAPFTRALQSLQCACEDAWFVGDHPRNDILGATAAGLRPIWLRGVHPWPDTEPLPERHVGTIREVLTLIGQPRKADTVVVRRRWNAPERVAISIDALWDLHFRDEPGGVCRALPRAFLCAYAWCDKVPGGALSHQCRADPPPPHELQVCILPADNPADLYENLRQKARG